MSKRGKCLGGKFFQRGMSVADLSDGGKRAGAEMSYTQGWLRCVVDP